MIAALPLHAIAAELSSQYDGDDFKIDHVATDSRRIQRGDLYVALQGERFDGHDFIDAVAAQGARAAIVKTRRANALPQLQVSDTRAALGLIARMNRRQFGGPLIAITGSAGKTTTKEMLAAILAHCGATLATQGNLNNEIGVPLTLLRIAPEHRYAVIEMGAARTGDIAYLCRFAEPDIAVLTSALPAHLEGFGTLDNVAKTKGEIFAGLRAHGTAVINIDSEYETLWRQLAGERRVITFGLRAEAMVTARAIDRTANGTRFELQGPAGSAAIELQLLGTHNVRNALAAAAAAIAAGAPLAAIKNSLQQMRAVPGRLQARRGRGAEIVIDDSYNANPGAVKAAIDVLIEYPQPRRLILGNMAELGADAERLHIEVADYAASRGIEELWCVGPFAKLQAQTFLARADNADAKAFADNAQIIAALERAPIPATVLVKGSRSSALEVVVAALCGDSIAEGH
ncbi:MAG TPA: UDP-N-acetylmuramoyl-tripeptide--D-alanyl-D-alanine ligase [Spongiibacteraceae bacterium]